MSTLDNSRFQRIARAMSRNFDIEVVSEGLRFETDGKRITFPANSDYLKDADQCVLHGLIDHETLHILEEQESKKKCVRTPIDILNSFHTNKEKIIFNSLEDFRIERKYSQQYVGVCENLRSTLEHFINLYNSNGLPDGGWWWKFSLAISSRLNKLPLNGLEVYEPLLEMISEELNDALNVATHFDVEKIVKRIIDKITNEYDVNADETIPTSVLVLNGLKGETDDVTTLDIYDVAKKHIEKVARNDSKSNKRYIVDPKILKLDKWEKVTVDNSYSTIKQYNIDKDKIRSQISAMRARFLNLVWSEQVPTVTTGHNSGLIDKKRAAKIITGSTSVYKKIEEGTELDTAICVLVDLSGSMGTSFWNDNKSYYAKLTCMGLSETFDAIKVPNALYGFYNESSYSRIKSTPGTVRDEPFVYKIFKEFDEPYNRVKTRLREISGYQNNVDGEAVMAAALRLNTRSESRKVLIVVSDGMPNGGDIPTDMLEKHLKDSVKMITKSGIEVLGIGIQTDSVKEFYNESTGSSNIVIDDLNTMATSVYRGVRSLVLKKIRRR